MDSDSARRFRRRDYTSEPIRTRDTPIYKEENKPRRKKSKKKWFIGVIFILLLATGVSLWILTHGNSNYSQLRKDLAQAQKEVSFPVLVPEKLPKDFAYKKGSVKTSSGIVLYSLQDGKDKSVSVSQQAKPAISNFDDFYNRVLTNRTSVLSTQGKAVLGTNGSQTIGSLITDKAWILLNTTSHIDNHTLSELINSLQPL
jgi:intein/homing endonuclease